MISNTLTSPKAVNISWCIDNTPCLFTIGYEGLTVNSFIEKLLANDIRVLIDVRNNPQSRKPGFSKSVFRDYLERAGIIYQHIPELGVPSTLRKNLGTEESYQSLFTYYEKEILPLNLDYIEKIKEITTRFSRVALTCFEADYHTCHRHKITEYLSQEPSFKARVVHLK
jgi:uncharacterized protein (DUF488 family)